MIVGNDWIWLHVPKCAGSATEKVLRQLYSKDPTFKFDEINPPGRTPPQVKKPRMAFASRDAATSERGVGRHNPVIWHQSIAQRRELDSSFDAGSRRVFGNIRRLPSWFLSRVHFEVQRSDAGGVVTRGMLVRGKYRNRPVKGQKLGRPVKADATIGKFASEVTDWIRSENLIDDLSALIGVDAARVPLAKSQVNRGRIDYIRDLNFWFCQEEIDLMYAENPIWADLEKRVYGDLLRLDD